MANSGKQVFFMGLSMVYFLMPLINIIEYTGNLAYRHDEASMRHSPALYIEYFSSR